MQAIIERRIKTVDHESAVLLEAAMRPKTAEKIGRMAASHKIDG